MHKQILAIALCRVSSTEQLENNSLNRQREAVLNAAKELDVVIPNDGWWSGSVSSKRGTNLKRKDLSEMVDRCKKDRRIKFVIVDEPDRFMRSINEAAYFEVLFDQLGVTVWYASDPELNKGNLASKLLKFTKYLSAEGSNEERQRKSIAGQEKALREGRYTFAPKPGYKRGYERGIQEVHPVRGRALQKVLIRIATKQVTPAKALVELNDSEFMKDHAPYKMDKFRKIVTDPFYAGVVEINKQVKVRNENGLHEALISKEQHLELIKIMDGKIKNQSGPRKNGNPKYPLSNLVTHDTCTHSRINRFVGLDLHNGKNRDRIYEKYRCRTCNKSLSRADMHAQVMLHIQTQMIDKEGAEELLEALDIAWKQKEGDTERERLRLKHKVRSLKDAISQQVEAATDPANALIKLDLLEAISKKKEEIAKIEESIEQLDTEVENDKSSFLEFAFKFIDDVGNAFLEMSPENRLRCKEILFPAGFYMNADNKVYTPEISPLFRLGVKKKDAKASEFSHLVRVRGL